MKNTLLFLLFLPLLCAGQDFDFWTHNETHYVKGQPSHIENAGINQVEREGNLFIVRTANRHTRTMIEAHRIGSAEGNPDVWIYESSDKLFTVYVNTKAHALQITAREKDVLYVASYGPLLFRDALPVVNHTIQIP